MEGVAVFWYSKLNVQHILLYRKYAKISWTTIVPSISYPPSKSYSSKSCSLVGTTFLDLNQSKEQADFRTRFSTIDHFSSHHWTTKVRTPTYIVILKNIYSGATPTIGSHQYSDKINLEGGAREDDISPKLFKMHLQITVINKIPRDKKRIIIDRK